MALYQTHNWLIIFHVMGDCIGSKFIDGLSYYNFPYKVRKKV